MTIGLFSGFGLAGRTNVSECKHSPTVKLYDITNGGSCPLCLAARLTEAEALLQLCIPSLERDGRPHVVASVREFLTPSQADAAQGTS
jgi:hypothetical protein